MQKSIIGYGYVGKSMQKIFKDAYIYNDGERKIGTAKGVNETDLAIICVPTPIGEDGECDTSIVEYVINWIKCPYILIKSTVPPGTTDMLREKYGKRICFSPEFVGEGNYWIPEWKYLDPIDPTKHPFQIIGGEKEDTKVLYDEFLDVLGPCVRILQTSASVAEAVKYADNIYGAMKVVWANEMYSALQAMGVDYREVRELFLHDPRMSEMHTAIFENRGYKGKCYPKDVKAFIRSSEQHDYIPYFLREIDNSNERLIQKRR